MTEIETEKESKCRIQNIDKDHDRRRIRDKGGVGKRRKR